MRKEGNQVAEWEREEEGGNGGDKKGREKRREMKGREEMTIFL